MTTWTPADVLAADRRPGTFANFTAQATLATRGGLNGIVAATVRAPWGPGGTIQEITTNKQITDLYTNSELATFNAYFVLTNILQGGTNKILAYRLLGPAAAKSTLALDDTTGSPVNVMDFFGKYEGARANSFTITIAANAGNASRKDITLIESGVTLRVWTTRLDNAAAGMITDVVAQINDDDLNTWVTLTKIADGNNTLADIGATSMASGVDDEGNIVAADYDEAMDAFEIENFEYVYFESNDATIWGTNIPAWIAATRTAGKKIVWVTGSTAADAVSAAKTDAETLNTDGAVYVHPGYKDNNLAGVEVTYDGYLAAARVAGLMAGISLNESLTFRRILNINDVEVRLSSANIRDLLESGIVVLTYDGGDIKIERGINTLTTLSTIQSETNQKIRPTRILDNINNAIVTSLNDNVIGRVSNNLAGQNSVLQVISSFLDTQVLEGTIAPGFTVGADPDNAATADRFFVLVGLQPIDAIEFIYLTIEVD